MTIKSPSSWQCWSIAVGSPLRLQQRRLNHENASQQSMPEEEALFKSLMIMSHRCFLYDALFLPFKRKKIDIFQDSQQAAWLTFFSCSFCHQSRQSSSLKLSLSLSSKNDKSLFTLLFVFHDKTFGIEFFFSHFFLALHVYEGGITRELHQRIWDNSSNSRVLLPLTKSGQNRQEALSWKMDWSLDIKKVNFILEKSISSQHRNFQWENGNRHDNGDHHHDPSSH